jgi:hypothetical protein
VALDDAPERREAVLHRAGDLLSGVGLPDPLEVGESVARRVVQVPRLPGVTSSDFGRRLLVEPRGDLADERLAQQRLLKRRLAGHVVLRSPEPRVYGLVATSGSDCGVTPPDELVLRDGRVGVRGPG